MDNSKFDKLKKLLGGDPNTTTADFKYGEKYGPKAVNGPSLSERYDQAKQIMNEPNDDQRNAIIQALGRFGRAGMAMMPSDYIELPGGGKMALGAGVGSIGKVGSEAAALAEEGPAFNWKQAKDPANGDIIEKIMPQVEQKIGEVIPPPEAPPVDPGKVLVKEAPKKSWGKVNVKY